MTVHCSIARHPRTVIEKMRPGRGTRVLYSLIAAAICALASGAGEPARAQTAMGGVFWTWQGWTQLRDASVYWTKAGVGLALVVAAGHALRVSRTSPIKALRYE